MKPAATLSMTLLAACCILLTSQRADAAASDPTPPGWLTYLNTKYDFDICYPPSLQAAPEAAAGDGRIFTGPAGGTLKVFWRPGTEGDTLTRTADTEMSGGTAPSVVTYTAGHADWAVRSGRQGDQIVYVKVIQRGSDYLIMRTVYPASAGAAWNAMVGRFAACFESSRPH